MSSQINPMAFRAVAVVVALALVSAIALPILDLAAHVMA